MQQKKQPLSVAPMPLIATYQPPTGQPFLLPTPAVVSSTVLQFCLSRRFLSRFCGQPAVRFFLLIFVFRFSCSCIFIHLSTSFLSCIWSVRRYLVIRSYTPYSTDACSVWIPHIGVKLGPWWGHIPFKSK